ncbi:MAG: type II secretion system minor pseudopilin GspJ [Proteobacteria bacterium]|nr:type II secretion system minor pseudopilin GspJ [Pseudomonadota bacterium]
MKKQSCNKLSQRGYTLVEVLAALTIFIIIISIISYTFLQILKNTDSVKLKEERIIAIQSMITILEFDLSQVIAKVSQSQNSPQPTGSFYTRANHLHFCKTGNINPDYEYDRSSLEEIEYYLENEQLVKLSKNDKQVTYKKQILLDNITGFEWALYDNRLGQYKNWPPTQDWQYTTPSIIKLTITLKDVGKIEKIIDMANHG